MADEISRNRSLRLPTPFGVRLLRHAMNAAEDLPVAATAVRGLRDVEAWAVAELKHRLEVLTEAREHAPPARDGSPAELLSALLYDADRQSLDQARERAYQAILQSLCPDQAKMLAVLADGHRVPLCHVGAAVFPGGPIREIVLHNATTLGRDAGVTLRALVPVMVTRMRDLGLLELGPEEPEMKTAFEILETDEAMHAAVHFVKDRLKAWPRVLRHSVGLSPFGRELWLAAQPTE